ncbi:MAG TPA: SUMF1/EgtB/PvdO family nonheme iron enzyme [Spirochaetota bacterium]|nr:SUMF1/EgtB/PvdO family nonheme iron enzyme [Spirochaetota bacterium]
MKLCVFLTALGVFITGSLVAAMPANMVRVEGGTFAMGNTLDGGGDDEKPVHQVTVSSFWMAKYEVTQREWREVMGNNPSHFDGENRPVEQVSWLDAINYCNKRSIKEGLTPAYSRSGAEYVCNFAANGYRLPTEAEWEYAARGGAAGANELVPQVYSGSDAIDDVAWYGRSSSEGTASVGQKRPNQLGLYDMSGNVLEWCWDWYGSYESGAATNPRGASSGSYRVRRGGSWINDASGVRVADRNCLAPTHRFFNLGFRVVRSL